MEQNSIILQGTVFHYRIEHKAIKNIYIRFQSGIFVVHCPFSCKDNEIIATLQMQEKRLFSLYVIASQRPQLPLEEGATISLLGTSYTLTYGSRVELDGNRLIVKESDPLAGILLIAKQVLVPYVAVRYPQFASVLLNQSPPQLFYRVLKSRYGYYTPSQNSITLNVMLAFLRKELVDYVIVHELAHVKILPHNDEFYREVGIVLPHYRLLQRQLKQEGIVL